MSTFNEFSFMLDEYQFDVIALSETWLKDCKYQQSYVQINGYNAVLKIEPIRWWSRFLHKRSTRI